MYRQIFCYHYLITNMHNSLPHNYIQLYIVSHLEMFVVRYKYYAILEVPENNPMVDIEQ